jgi:hypothetical protein
MKLFSEPGPLPEDRRDALRLPAGFTGDVETETDEGVVLKAQLVDVSRTGLRLRLTRPLEPGATLTVCAPSFEALVPCRVEVVRETQSNDPEGWHEYGMRFLDHESGGRHSWFLTLRKREAA